MRNKLIISLFCILLVAGFTACQNDPVTVPEGQDEINGPVQDDGLVPGVLNIKFKPGTDVKAIEAALQQEGGPATRTGLSALDLLNGKYKVKEMKRIFPYSPKFEKRHEKHGLHLWYRIEVDTTLNTRSIAQNYSDIKDIEIASPVVGIKLWDNSKVTLLDEGEKQVGAEKQGVEALPFNDPQLNKQWHYDKGKLDSPLEEANIGLFPAWQICAGDPGVVVAVIDGGVDYRHEDLTANMWRNLAESTGRDGIDDDGNDYTDDIYGYNFVARRGEPAIMDHGTHVAGTVAAVNNNGIGVCGVAGGTGKGDGVKVMSCDIFGANESNATRSREAEAFIYAADMGAVIAQNSWGYTLPGYKSPVVEDAINYFIKEAGNAEDHPNSPMRGGIVIFAAGNDGATGQTFYPAAYPQVIAVTATDYRNERASLTRMDHTNNMYYANIAGWVDIAAPGGMSEYLYGVLSTVSKNHYGYMYGTSMAAPHVAGVAALILARLKGPEFTNDKLKEILLSSVMDISEYEPRYARNMGRGLIRADIAVGNNDGVAPGKVDNLSVVQESSAGCLLKWSVTKDQGDGVPALYRIYYSTSESDLQNGAFKQSAVLKLENAEVGKECTYKVEGLKAGVWYFAVAGEDKWGNRSECSNIVFQRLGNAGEDMVYPSVVTDEVNVVLSDAFKGNLTVRIYDVAGNLVLQYQYRETNHLRVNVAGLPSGAYILRVKASGVSKNFRIVKKQRLLYEK